MAPARWAELLPGLKRTVSGTSWAAGVGVNVEAAVAVAVGDRVGVSVALGLRVCVGLGVGGSVGLGAGIVLPVGVLTGVAVAVGAGTSVGVAVAGTVGSGVGARVAVPVGVAVARAPAGGKSRLTASTNGTVRRALPPSLTARLYGTQRRIRRPFGLLGDAAGTFVSLVRLHPGARMQPARSTRGGAREQAMCKRLNPRGPKPPAIDERRVDGLAAVYAGKPIHGWRSGRAMHRGYRHVGSVAAQTLAASGVQAQAKAVAERTRASSCASRGRTLSGKAAESAATRAAGGSRWKRFPLTKRSVSASSAKL